MTPPAEPLPPTRFATQAEPSSAGEPPPVNLGPYTILQEVGRGGMGRVYRARHEGLGRVVALKTILAAELASPAAVHRLRKEAEAAAQLDHPGIVPIYEFGEANGQHFIVMALVEGRGLDARLRKGPLDNRLAAFVVQHVAHAVAYAHGKGVVHRDLKPGNVLIDRDGSVRVTDFGLARRLDAPPDAEPEEDHPHGRVAEVVHRLTVTGSVMGTPSYMAPEQALDSKNAGLSADVWALGALLYECLTGRPPFLGTNVVDTLAMTIAEEPVAPRTHNPSVDPALEAVCLKCLRKRPEQRYATAADVADDLARWQAGRPVRAARVPVLARLWRAVSIHPALLPVLAGLLVWRVANVQEGVFVGCAVAGMRLTPRPMSGRDVSMTALLGLALAVFYGFYVGEHLTVPGNYAAFFGLEAVAPGAIPFPLEPYLSGLPFFLAFALVALPLGSLLVLGLGSLGDSPDEPSAVRLLCWLCLAVAAVGLLVVPALAFPIPYPRPEQLWLERLGLILLVGWAAFATFRSERTPQVAWMSAATLALVVLVLGPLVVGFLGLREIGKHVPGMPDLGPTLRREGWALTFWLLNVPVGVSVGVMLGGLRQRLAGRGSQETAGIFQLGAALTAIVAPVVLRAVRPDVTVGFACYGPGPTTAFAGWLLTHGLRVNVAAAAAFIFPVKIALLTLPLAAGGVAAGTVARRFVRAEGAP